MKNKRPRIIMCAFTNCRYNHKEKCRKRKLSLGYLGVVNSAVCGGYK